MPSSKLPSALLLFLSMLLACDSGDGASSEGSTSSGTGALDSTGVSLNTAGSDSGSSSTEDSTTSTSGDSSGSPDTSDSDGSSSSGHATDTTGGTAQPVALTEYEPNGPEITLPAPGDNASGVTWNYDTDRVWIVQNGSARFYEYPADDLSTPIRSIDLVGINSSDTEGLAYMGGGEVAIAFEGGYGVYIADVPDGDADITVGVKQTLVLAPPPPVGNNGLEGVAYDPDASVFYAVGEGQDPAAPRRFFRFARPDQTEGDFDWQDPELEVEEPFIADRALPESGASLDLAGVAFDPRDGNVLIISHTGTRVIQLDPAGDGTILSELMLPSNQWEGVAIVGPGYDLMLVAESNELQRYSFPAR